MTRATTENSSAHGRSANGRAWAWVRAALAAGLVTLVALASVAVDATAGPSPRAQALGDECKPVVFAFRGSGEGNVRPWVTDPAGESFRYGETDLVTDGWEGDTLTRVLARYSARSFNGVRNDTYRVIPIGPSADGLLHGYPAVAAGWGALGGLDASAGLGAREAIRRFETIKRQTPEPCRSKLTYIAFGFSQGAMAARALVHLLPEQAAGVVTMGDPLQKPDGVDGVVGSGRTGQGILRKAADSRLTRLYDSFYDHPVPRSMLCHDRDPICDIRLSTLTELISHPQHSNYAISDDEADSISDKIAEFAFYATARASGSADGSQRSLIAPASSSSFAPMAESAGAPEAIVTADPFAVVGRDVTIAATASTFDTGTTIAFDLDDDGTFETDDGTSVITARWDSVGDHRVAVRVTDADGRASEASTVVTVQPDDILDSRYDPASPDKVLSVSRSSATAGGEATLRIAGLDPDEEVGVRLVEGDDDFVWDDEGLAYWDGVTTDGTVSLPLPTDLEAGDYRVVVASEEGGLGTDVLSVEPAAAGTATAQLAATGSEPAPLGIAGALLVAGALGLLWASRRRRDRLSLSRRSRP